MSNARRDWRHLLGLAALAVLLLAGCATLPPGSDYPRTASNALTHPEQTRLGRQFAGPSAAHAGLSAFRLLPVGIDSFLLRLERAQLAERTLDAQYFVIENDDTGRLIGIVTRADLVRAPDPAVARDLPRPGRSG